MIEINPLYYRLLKNSFIISAFPLDPDASLRTPLTPITHSSQTIPASKHLDNPPHSYSHIHDARRKKKNETKSNHPRANNKLRSQITHHPPKKREKARSANPEASKNVGVIPANAACFPLNSRIYRAERDKERASERQIKLATIARARGIFRRRIGFVFTGARDKARRVVI